MTSKALIDKLDSLFEMQVDFIDYEGLAVIFHKNVGAISKDLDLINSGSNLRIPQDYIDFLAYTDGCLLYKYQDLGGFEFLSTKDIDKENKLQKETYENDWDDNITVFCRLVCDGDFISFRTNKNGTYDILDCYHDDSPKNWTIIDNSFERFLEKLIESKGKRFWIK